MSYLVMSYLIMSYLIMSYFDHVLFDHALFIWLCLYSMLDLMSEDKTMAKGTRAKLDSLMAFEAWGEEEEGEAWWAETISKPHFHWDFVRFLL